MTNTPEVLLRYRMHPKQISAKSADRQQQVATQIQHRYWGYVFKTLQLDPAGIDEVLKIRASGGQQPNMDKVDATLTALLQNAQGEAREAILSHITRLYYRVAADCPDVVARWNKFFPEHPWRATVVPRVKLWLLSRCHLHPQSRVYAALKKAYVALLRQGGL